MAHKAGKARPSSYQVLLKVDEKVLADPDAEGCCEVQGGVGVSVQTARRICCDAPVLEVHEAGGHHCDTHDGHACTLHLKRTRRKASAALAASIFHFQETTVMEVKRQLREWGIAVREPAS